MEYRVKTAVSDEIVQHLKACDSAFIPELSQKVNIEEYAVKIADKAHTFEAWEGKELVGLIAVYINFDSLTAFITNVSVLSNYSRAGIGKELLHSCIGFLKNNSIKKVSLEVGISNSAALELYKKFNFIESDFRTETKMMELKIA